jgi:hypothetical protein
MLPSFGTRLVWRVAGLSVGFIAVCALPSAAMASRSGAESLTINQLKTIVSRNAGAVVAADARFEQPVSSRRLRRGMAALGLVRAQRLQGQVAAGSQTITMGIEVPRAMSLRQAAVAFYRRQQRSANNVVAKLRTSTVESGRARKGKQPRSLKAAQAYRDALATGKPVLREVRGTFAARTLLRALERRHPVALVTINAPRKLSRATGRRPTARAADDIAQEDYMPRLWYVQTDLIENPGDPGSPPPRGASLKMTMIRVQWETDTNLSWYQGDDHHRRGFEIESYPASADAIWSDGWSGDEDAGSWASNLPSAYRDDLTSDGDIKHFAIGTGDAKSLVAGDDYWVNYDTNDGHTDEGMAHVDGQATARASWDDNVGWIPPPFGGAGEGAYCAAHLDSDAACFFAVDTTPVPPDYPIGSGWNSARVLWGTCPKPPYDLWPSPEGECLMDF